MIKILSLLILITPISTIYAEIGRKVITNPAITRRCLDLLDKRRQKVSNKQRLLGLLNRNQNMRKNTPPNKVTLIRKLEDLERRIEGEIEYSRHKILNVEEEIIRKGCPNISI